MVAVTGAPGLLISTWWTFSSPTCSATANATANVTVYAIVASTPDAFYVSVVKAVIANT